MIVARFHGGKFDGRLRKLSYPMPICEFALMPDLDEWVMPKKNDQRIDVEFRTEVYELLCRDDGGAYRYVKK